MKPEPNILFPSEPSFSSFASVKRFAVSSPNNFVPQSFCLSTPVAGAASQTLSESSSETLRVSQSQSLPISAYSFSQFPLRPQFAPVQTGVKVGDAMAVQPVRSAKEIAPPISLYKGSVSLLSLSKEIPQDTLSPNHFVIKLFCHHSPQVIPFEVLAPQPPLKFVKARKASKNCAPLNLPVKPSTVARASSRLYRKFPTCPPVPPP